MGFQFLQIKDNVLFHGWNGSKTTKIHLRNFKFFSWTTRPILTKLGTKYPLVEGIQVCLNERPLSFQGRVMATFNQHAFKIITFALACLLLGNVSQVSDVAHGHLVCCYVFVLQYLFVIYCMFIFGDFLFQTAALQYSPSVSVTSISIVVGSCLAAIAAVFYFSKKS